MNRGEISSKIIDWSHRYDLAGQIDLFIDSTTNRLNLRLGKDYTLQGNTGTNEISDAYPHIYIYGGLREMAIYTQDAVAEQGYEMLYENEVSRLNITGEATGFTDDSPVILSECEQLVEEEANGT